MRKGLLVILCLAVAPVLAADGPPRKADAPTDYLLLPAFEVDTVTPGGLTTFFAVHNQDDAAVDARVRYFDKDGVAQVSEDFILGPHQTRTVDLRSVEGLAVDPDGVARGSLEVMTCSTSRRGQEHPEVLTGDYFYIDSAGNFANGDQLLRREDLCDELMVRIIDFGSASKLRLLSTDPQGPSNPTAAYEVLDEAGNQVAKGMFFVTDEVEVLDSTALSAARFGTLLLDFIEGAGMLSVEYSAFGRFSVTMNATCIGQSLDVANTCVAPPGR